MLTQLHVQLVDHIVGIPKGQLVAIVAAHIAITGYAQLGEGCIVAPQSPPDVGALLVHGIAPPLVVDHGQVESLAEIGMGQASGAFLLMMEGRAHVLARVG